jgi:hypothetical protein
MSPARQNFDKADLDMGLLLAQTGFSTRTITFRRGADKGRYQCSRLLWVSSGGSRPRKCKSALLESSPFPISLTDAQPPAAAVIACLHQAPAEVVEIFGPTPERRYEDYRVALSTNRDIDGRVTVFTVCCRLVPDCTKAAFNDTNERATAYKNRLNLTKIYALILTKASIANEFCRPQSGLTEPTRKG